MGFQIERIEPDAEFVTDVLGITRERKIELDRIVEHAYADTNDNTEAANIFLAKCNHFNEAYHCISYYTEIELARKFFRNLRGK